MDGLTSLRSDASLVRGSLAHESSALETLVERYQRKAFAVARGAGVEPAELEDVVQEAFLHAFRSLPELRDPAAFGGWFLSIVRNLARKHVRGRSRAPVGLGDQAVESAERVPPEDVGEIRAELERQLAALPEVLRETIFLYYYEGESSRRVARTLGITVSSVRSRLKRGRDILKERLWRRLEDSIRERFPSTREWRRRAGRTALLVLASVGSPSAIRAAAPSAPAGSAGTWILLGGIMASKKAVLFTAAAILLLSASTVAVIISIRPDPGGMDSRGATQGRVAKLPGPRLTRVPDVKPVVVSAREPDGLPQAGNAFRFELVDAETGDPVNASRAVVEPAGSVDVTLDEGRMVVRLAAGDARPPGLSVQVPGYIQEALPLDGEPAGTPAEAIQVLLNPGLRASGMVVDRRSRSSVAGARVRFFWDWDQSPPPRPYDEVVTRDDGFFLVGGGVREKETVLEVEASGYARLYRSLKFPTGEPIEGIVLDLEPGHCVRGRVDAGEALPPELPVEVMLTALPERQRWPRVRLGFQPDDSRIVALPPGGAFEICGLPEGSYVINATVEDRRFCRDNWSDEVEVGGDGPAPEVHLSIGPGQTIRGRVIHAGGLPAVNGNIYLMSPRWGWSPPGFGVIRVAADGRFEIPGTREGAVYSLRIVAKGAEWQEFPVSRMDDTYILERTRSFRITAFCGGVELKRDSFLGWTVFDDPSAPGRWQYEGTYLSEEVKSGAFRKALVWVDGYAPVVLDLETAAESDLRLELEEGATLEGRVETVDGRPLQGIEVKVTANILGPETRKLVGPHYSARSDKSDAQGRFKIRGLPRDPAILETRLDETDGWKPVRPLDIGNLDRPVTFVLSK